MERGTHGGPELECSTGPQLAGPPTNYSVAAFMHCHQTTPYNDGWEALYCIQRMLLLLLLGTNVQDVAFA